MKSFFLILVSIGCISQSFSQGLGSLYQEIDLGGKSDVWNTALSGDSNIFAGGSITFADNNMGALVMKTNINGIIQWVRALKGPRVQLFRRVYPLKDSGILGCRSIIYLPGFK